MRCEYTVTYQDFLEAMKGYRKMSKRAAIRYWLWIWIIPVACLAVGLTCLLAYFRQDEGLFGSLFWPSFICLGLAFGLPAGYRKSLKRGFKLRNTLAKGNPMFFEFDDAMTRFIVPGGTEITYPWGSFTNYFENDRIAVLFVQEAVFHTIPRRAMDEETWNAFKVLVNQRVGKS